MFKKKSRMITGAAVFVLSTGLLVSCGQKETAGTFFRNNKTVSHIFHTILRTACAVSPCLLAELSL